MNECNIVRDLLPLYADDLASEDSVEFIDRHTENCPQCRCIWQRYKGELPQIQPPVPEQIQEEYRKPIKKGIFRIVLSALATWLVLFAVLGYLVWEVGWLGEEKQLISPDGNTIFVVKDYSNAGFFNKGGVYVLTPDGQGRDLKNRTDFKDLHIWWASDSSTYFVWWEFEDHDESYYVSYAELEKAGGWVDYREQKGIYGVNFFDELSALLLEQGIESIEFDFMEWSGDSMNMRFHFTTADGQSGTLNYSLENKGITEIIMD